MRERMLSNMPPIIGPLVFSMLSSHLRKQLYARGLARHTPDIVAAKGRADIDALAAFLGDKPFLLDSSQTQPIQRCSVCWRRWCIGPCRRRSPHTLNP